MSRSNPLRKIRYSPYELKGTRFQRQGALLQVEFDHGLVGYADCHPWEELGDLSLKQQIKMLLNGQTTSLTYQSLYFAAIDAEARSQKKNLLEDLEIPLNHYLLPNAQDFTSVDKAFAEGFSFFKVKANDDDFLSVKGLLRYLKKHQGKLRIDFNNKLSFEQFQRWIPTLDEYSSILDFVEDPFVYEGSQWKTIKKNHQIGLAADFNPYYKNAAHVYILKPAVQTHHVKCDRIVVTSYLDHPLGQCCAAYIAGKLSLSEHCGLLSHRIYESNPYSQCLSQKGPQFTPTLGTGFGFDDLLKGQTWKNFI